MTMGRAEERIAASPLSLMVLNNLIWFDSPLILLEEGTTSESLPLFLLCRG